MAKTKFDLDDLYLIFEVTEVILNEDICKMVSTQYLKKYLTYPHQIWYTEARGQAKTKFELRDLNLIFKVTEVIEGDDI